MRNVSVVSAFLFSFAIAAAAEPAASPREKVETAIEESVRLLEAKEYVTFLKTIVDPDELKEITKQVPIEELAKQFGQHKAPTVLKALKLLKDIKPTMSADGKKATFVLKEPVGPMKSVNWRRIDKFWYMQNR